VQLQPLVVGDLFLLCLGAHGFCSAVCSVLSKLLLSDAAAGVAAAGEH